jgi:hypothetical protein
VPLTDRLSIWSPDTVSLDRELEALQHAVDAARRNHWVGGDVIEPEFEQFLAALTRPATLNYGATIEADPAWRGRKNSWREVLDQVE